MQVNIQEFLAECGVDEPFYPGKRMVKKLPQPGQYKSHCVVFDWRAPDTLRLELKAGQSGKTLLAKDLKQYPVSFQAPTYVDLAISKSQDQDNTDENADADDDEDGGTASGGKSGGGGKKPRQKKKPELGQAMKAFGSVVEGQVPDVAAIKKMVVMGKEIAQEAFGPVLETLTAQIREAKIVATDLMAQAGKYITKYMPPSFMKPVGDEDVTYKYDREKNADIGLTRRLSLSN